jgi:hypothetical protein
MMVRKESESLADKKPQEGPRASPDIAGASSHADSSRVQRIREAAYRLAHERGFSPGAEIDDWLAAERQIDEELSPVDSGGQKED